MWGIDVGRGSIQAMVAYERRGLMDELLKEWREVYDVLVALAGPIKQEISNLQEQLSVMCEPYENELDAIEGEIKEAALANGESTKAHGVAVSYRSGYERVSYDPKQTDMILGMLRDVLPETAVALEGARKSSRVAPFVSIKAID